MTAPMLNGGILPYVDAGSCEEPVTRYAIGQECSWHDYSSQAAVIKRVREDGSLGLACPHCLGEAVEVSMTTWTDMMRIALKKNTEAKEMADWSRGRCFPDSDTMLNAYRQAKEE